MKRTYICPTTKIFVIETQGAILNTSTIRVSQEVYYEGHMTDLVKSDSRSFSSIWDDDWSLQ